MLRDIVWTVMVMLALILLFGSIPGNARSAGPLQSTAQGVFSDAQSARGRNAYLANCSSGCHGPNLLGGGSAPALAGDAFIARWRGMAIYTLFDAIRSTMPKNRPHSLTDATYTDIVAFLLDANGFPSTEHELVADPSTLKRIAISDPNAPG